MNGDKKTVWMAEGGAFSKAFETLCTYQQNVCMQKNPKA
jgi:hypothetical protein